MDNCEFCECMEEYFNNEAKLEDAVTIDAKQPIVANAVITDWATSEFTFDIREAKRLENEK